MRCGLKPHPPATEPCDDPHRLTHEGAPLVRLWHLGLGSAQGARTARSASDPKADIRANASKLMALRSATGLSAPKGQRAQVVKPEMQDGSREN